MKSYKIIICSYCGCENVLIPEEFNNFSVICQLCEGVLDLCAGCGGLVKAPNLITPALLFCSQACELDYAGISREDLPPDPGEL